MNRTTPRDNLALFGESTKEGIADEVLRPQQPVNDRHTKHLDLAGLTAKLRNASLDEALMFKEHSTMVGGMLTNLLGMRQESSNHAPDIKKGAVRVIINPTSFPKDSEESYVATVAVVYGQPTTHVSIMQEFSRMMRVAATATVTRDRIPTPAPGDAEAQQQHEDAKRQADKAAVDGTAAVSSAVKQPGLLALREEDLAVVELKGLTVAKQQSREGTKYYAHTFSSAAAAALAAMGPLYICDGRKVVCVEPLRLNNPEEMKYAVLYRTPSAALLSSDAMLLAVRDTLVKECRETAKTLAGQRKRLSAADAASYIAAIPTGLGQAGRMLLEKTTADDMRLIVSTIKGTPIARLDPKVLERLLQRGGLFAVRYADAQSQLLGATMAMVPGRGFPGQQRIKAAVSNLSRVGGSGVFWAADEVQPDPALVLAPALVEAQGSKPPAGQVAQQLMAALALDLPLQSRMLAYMSGTHVTWHPTQYTNGAFTRATPHANRILLYWMPLAHLAGHRVRWHQQRQSADEATTCSALQAICYSAAVVGVLLGPDCGHGGAVQLNRSKAAVAGCSVACSSPTYHSASAAGQCCRLGYGREWFLLGCCCSAIAAEVSCKSCSLVQSCYCHGAAAVRCSGVCVVIVCYYRAAAVMQYTCFCYGHYANLQQTALGCCTLGENPSCAESETAGGSQHWVTPAKTVWGELFVSALWYMGNVLSAAPYEWNVMLGVVRVLTVLCVVLWMVIWSRAVLRIRTVWPNAWSAVMPVLAGASSVSTRVLALPAVQDMLAVLSELLRVLIGLAAKMGICTASPGVLSMRIVLSVLLSTIPSQGLVAIPCVLAALFSTMHVDRDACSAAYATGCAVHASCAVCREVDGNCLICNTMHANCTNCSDTYDDCAIHSTVHALSGTGNGVYVE